MASTERIFFAGVATAVVLIGAGFGSGVMLGKTALEPTPQAKAAQIKVADKAPPPPARVVLPAITEAAPSPVTVPALSPVPAPIPPVQAAAPMPPEPQAKPAPEPNIVSEKVVQLKKQDFEKEKQAERQAEAYQVERAERRKKAAERERHRRYADRKARQVAAREQQQHEEQEQPEQQEQQQHELRRQMEPRGVLALDEGNEPPREQSSFFGD